MDEQIESTNKLSIGKAAKYLGVSIDTLRRWEKKGRIAPLRSPGGHRYFIKGDLDKLFGKRYTRDLPTKKKAEPKFKGITLEHTPTTPEKYSIESDTQVTPAQNDSPPPPPAPIQDKPKYSLKTEEITQPPQPQAPSEINIPPLKTSEVPTQLTEEPAKPDVAAKSDPSILTSDQKSKLEDIISTEKPKKGSDLTIKLVIISLIIFASLNVIFAYLYLSSTGILSPIP